MATTVVGASLPVIAAEAPLLPLTMMRLAPDSAAGSVLGLDSDDTKTGMALTTALRKAFANRGLSGGEEISLEEMRLTMGCDNDSVACLSSGGQTLGVRRLVFGYLRTTGKGKLQLDIQILDTESGSLESQASIDLTKSQLSAGSIDQTATDIVNQLMPTETDESDLPPGGPDLPVEVDEGGEGDPALPDEGPPPKEGKIYFGLEKPTPGWKWAGFGTSLGLTLLAGGAAIGMGVWLTTKEGGFRKKLLTAAEDSLTDNNGLNDVDPNLPEGVDLCEFARSRPVDPNTNEPLGQPGQVRNASVVEVCNLGADIQRGQLAAGIGAGVFGVSTLVFTGLLFIHKRKPAADAMLRHNVRLGLGPTLDGNRGLTLSGGMRF
ncbi:MAG: hypothetical protein KC501_13800 [Myxococcales bacterium]|nr:hypothetical protein [Myxococcales bacterium]